MFNLKQQDYGIWSLNSQIYCWAHEHNLVAEYNVMELEEEKKIVFVWFVGSLNESNNLQEDFSFIKKNKRVIKIVYPQGYCMGACVKVTLQFCGPIEGPLNVRWGIYVNGKHSK